MSFFAQVTTPSILDPQGVDAAHIAELWWVMLFLSTAICLLVAGLMLFGVFYGRDTPPQTGKAQGQNWIILGGIVMPAIVLAIVFVFTIRASALTANEAEPGHLTIEVTGRRWWWEVNYPEQGVITANEIHIPAGMPVELTLTSGDVIHSFWVPQLAGKMDLIPGRENTLVIQANAPGIYRGECAEFCGLQHARMQFLVIAEEPENFEQWVTEQQQAAQQPQGDLTERGYEVFIAAGCVYCHNVRGLDDGDVDRSAADLGPDLTHLASRTTIGAGTPGMLARWNGRRPLPRNRSTSIAFRWFTVVIPCGMRRTGILRRTNFSPITNAARHSARPSSMRNPNNALNYPAQPSSPFLPPPPLRSPSSA